MAREVPEWIGKDDNTKIPERVRDRVEQRAGGRCQICGVRVISGGETDHVVALTNWNPSPELPHGNRESNLQFACGPCHSKKTSEDVAEKAAIYKKRTHHSRRKPEQSPWSKRYHATKEWLRQKREAANKE